MFGRAVHPLLKQRLRAYRPHPGRFTCASPCPYHTLREVRRWRPTTTAPPHTTAFHGRACALGFYVCAALDIPVAAAFGRGGGLFLQNATYILAVVRLRAHTHPPHLHSAHTPLLPLFCARTASRAPPTRHSAGTVNWFAMRACRHRTALLFSRAPDCSLCGASYLRRRCFTLLPAYLHTSSCGHIPLWDMGDGRRDVDSMTYACLERRVTFCYRVALCDLPRCACGTARCVA